ncbi:hypothetical protein [Nocardia miyunensis]|uniref:hypothetical protein n=1 Tax=Nocardia miyunensis TaxID=282684 RepID=UPI0008326AAC|nr:hypothetical protein [Nocardia miyunensis]
MTPSTSHDIDRATGVLIAESLQLGSTLIDLDIVLTKITRLALEQPAAGQPPIWTLIEFSIAAANAEILADRIAEALDTGPWYVEFHTHTETFIIFRTRTFRFPRGDQNATRAATTHARTLGIPDHQLDWPR